MLTETDLLCIIVYVRFPNKQPTSNMRLLGQAVKTPPFHGGIRGSIPLGVTMYYGRIAQLGEHLPYKQRVTGSSPVVPTILYEYGLVAQLVRVPACHAGGRGFESLLGRHIKYKIKHNTILNEAPWSSG